MDEQLLDILTKIEAAEAEIETIRQAARDEVVQLTAVGRALLTDPYINEYERDYLLVLYMRALRNGTRHQAGLGRYRRSAEDDC